VKPQPCVGIPVFFRILLEIHDLSALIGKRLYYLDSGECLMNICRYIPEVLSIFRAYRSYSVADDPHNDVQYRHNGKTDQREHPIQPEQPNQNYRAENHVADKTDEPRIKTNLYLLYIADSYRHDIAGLALREEFEIKDKQMGEEIVSYTLQRFVVDDLICITGYEAECRFRYKQADGEREIPVRSFNFFRREQVKEKVRACHGQFGIGIVLGEGENQYTD